MILQSPSSLTEIEPSACKSYRRGIQDSKNRYCGSYCITTSYFVFVEFCVSWIDDPEYPSAPPLLTQAAFPFALTNTGLT